MSRKCQFRKKNGERCGADAQSGKSICVFHDPDRSEDGRRARRAGGLERSRPPAALPAETPDSPLRTNQDVLELLGESISQLRRGQLDPRKANAIGYLASISLRALGQGSPEGQALELGAALPPNATAEQIFKAAWLSKRQAEMAARLEEEHAEATDGISATKVEAK